MMKRNVREKKCNVPKTGKYFQNCTKLQLHVLYFLVYWQSRKQIYSVYTKSTLKCQSTIQNNMCRSQKCPFQLRHIFKPKPSWFDDILMAFVEILITWLDTTGSVPLSQENSYSIPRGNSVPVLNWICQQWHR